MRFEVSFSQVHVVQRRRRRAAVSILVALLFVGVVPLAFAQPVALVGKLHIGFGDDNNQITGFPGSNNALPKCAGLGPLVNTGAAGTTQGTLLIAAVGSAAPQG